MDPTAWGPWAFALLFGACAFIGPQIPILNLFFGIGGVRIFCMVGLVCSIILAPSMIWPYSVGQVAWIVLTAIVKGFWIGGNYAFDEITATL